MKILFFYTYNSGFLSSFYKELSRLLKRDGYDVVVSYIKNRDKEFVDSGIRCVEFQNRGYLAKFKNVFKVIKSENPDIIISNFGYINPALLFGKLLNVPKNIAWMHTVYGHQRPTALKVVNKQLLLKFSDLIITNSEVLKKEMSKIYKVPDKKVKSLPFWTSIVETPIAKPSDKLNFMKMGVRVGCPGRLLRDKNQAIVIEAIYELIKANKKIQLYIAGEGENFVGLKQLVEDRNLTSQVHFLGFLSSREMKLFYKSVDVIVLPSLNESFGLVLIETMALGVPVIVSNAFGALEFIDNCKYPLNQFTFDPNSIKDLNSKLIPYTKSKGIKGKYFREIYLSTFKKEEIYNNFLQIINSERQ